MTQENLHAPGYTTRQKRVTIDGNLFWADKEFIPLLKELNRVGLKTRSHCAGHDSERSFLVIKSDNVEGVEVRNTGEYKEVVIMWKRNK